MCGEFDGPVEEGLVGYHAADFDTAGGGDDHFRSGIIDAGGELVGSEAGELTRGALFDLVSSERTLAVLNQLSAASLKALLERGLAEPGSGAFLQLSNLQLEADMTQQPQVLAEDGTVATAGARVRRLATWCWWKTARFSLPRRRLTSR